MSRWRGRGSEIPAELRDAYFDALQRIPSLAAAAAEAQWDEVYCRAVAAAIVVAKGQPALGQVILELDPESAREFMQSRFG